MTPAPDASRPLDPTSLAGAEFAKVRKGYDPAEVRALLVQAAGLLRDAEAERARLAELVTQLESRPAAAPVDLEPAAIAAALGEETVRVIQAARDAAAEIRSKAEEGAALLVRESQEEADRLRADAVTVLERARSEAESIAERARADRDELLRVAESDRDELLRRAQSVLAERTAEAEEAAARIRAEAEATLASVLEEAEAARVAAATRAAEILDEAIARSARHLDDTRAQGRAMLEETKAVRERMLRGLAEKRRVARMQLEGARAGRERLAEGVESVRALLDDVARELDLALPAARQAADEASRSVADDLDAVVADLAAGLGGLESLELDGPVEVGEGAWSVLVDSSGAPAVAQNPAVQNPAVQNPAADEQAAEGVESEPAEVDTPAAEEPRKFPVIPMGELPGTGVGFEDFPDTDGESNESVAWSAAAESAAEGAVESAVESAVEAAEVPSAEVEVLVDPTANEAPVDPPYLLVPLEETGGVARVPGADATVISLADRRSRHGGPAVSESDTEEDVPAEEGAVEEHTVDVRIDVEVVATPAAAAAEELEVVEAVAEQDEELEAAAESADTAESDEGDAEPDDPAAEGDVVGDLFARLRATTEVPAVPVVFGAAAPSVAAQVDPEAADPEPVVADPEPVVVEADPVVAEADPVVAEADPVVAELDDEVVLDLRDQRLVPIERSVGRSLKRLVNDQQNEAQARLRQARKGQAVVAFADVDAVVEAHVRALESDLREAAEAGADQWRATGGPAQPADLDAVLVQLNESVRVMVVEGLVARVERAVARLSGDGTGSGELVEAVRHACREWRSQRVNEIAGDLVTEAFNRGSLAAAAPGASARWVVDHGGLPCADGDDNALAPPTPCGSPFPTGHSCAPAHPGCRCIVVPTPR